MWHKALLGVISRIVVFLFMNENMGDSFRNGLNSIKKHIKMKLKEIKESEFVGEHPASADDVVCPSSTSSKRKVLTGAQGRERPHAGG